MEKYEFRNFLTDAQVLSRYGIQPSSRPKLYFFSPSLMDLKGDCLYLNVFSESSADDFMDGFLSENFGELGQYRSFYLDFSGETRGSLDDTHKVAEFVYNGIRDNFITSARLYSDRIECDCDLFGRNLSRVRLYFNLDLTLEGKPEADKVDFIFNRDDLTLTATGFSIGLKDNLLSRNFKVKGWMYYA